MTLKKFKIIGIFLIFSLCFAFHFIYEFFPNTLFSLFFPVNESIWEHMKLLFTPFVLYTVVEYLFLRKYEKINNLYFQLFFIPIIGIALYLIIYLPIYYKIGDNMILNIGLLFIIICIQQFISYKFAKKDEFEYQMTLGVLGSLLVFATFTYLTYIPFEQEIFFDTQKEIYGIPNKKYNLLKS